jgi:hypothetical protein
MHTLRRFCGRPNGLVALTSRVGLLPVITSSCSAPPLGACRGCATPAKPCATAFEWKQQVSDLFNGLRDAAALELPPAEAAEMRVMLDEFEAQVAQNPPPEVKVAEAGEPLSEGQSVPPKPTHAHAAPRDPEAGPQLKWTVEKFAKQFKPTPRSPPRRRPSPRSLTTQSWWRSLPISL